MKTSRKTAGATLVLTVLVVMLLLAAVVVVTAQLAISARRSSADQDATVQAQYVAESGVARAQARLNTVSDLLTTSNLVTGGVATQMGIRIPDGTASLTIGNQILSLCGVSVLPSIGTVCSASDNVLKGVTATNGASRLALFTTYVSPDSFKAVTYPLSATNTAQAFWAQVFGGLDYTNTAVAGGNFTMTGLGVNIRQVERTGTDQYVITLAVPNVSAQSQVNGVASRKINVDSNYATYRLNIGRDPFSKYALFTNHHFSDATNENNCANGGTSCRITFTSNTVFSGPVHTNEVFNFQDQPYFGGPVSSAGCGAGKIVSSATGDSCAAGGTTAGAYAYGNQFTNAATLNAAANPLKPSICSGGSCSTPQFSDSINWNADFQQLPTNSNDQLGAARAGGLYINGTVSNMALAVSNIVPQGGASQKAQLITYTTGGVTTKLATTVDKKMYIQVGTVWKPAVQLVSTGAWVDASGAAAVAAVAANTNPLVPTFYNSFNGVVYADAPTGSDGIQNLNGPARTSTNSTNTSTSANTPPSVADFAQLNVVSDGDIHVTSDLTYENPPCSGSNVVSGTGASATFTPADCSNTTATNILGVYSSAGDVLLDSPVTNTPGMPKNVKIQAVLMASQGKVTVDGYATKQTGLGQVNLMGGIIENYYGAFGTVSSDGTNASGYGRNFVYDVRTGQGVMPPSFPTLKAWTSVITAGIQDKTTSKYPVTTIKLDGTQTQQKIQ